MGDRLNNRYTTVALIATILILGFATIAGAFLIPDIALAKKSKHNSDDDDTPSSSPSSTSSPPSVPFQSSFKSIGQGREDGVAAGAADARAGLPSNDKCPTSSSFSYCLGYSSGYSKGYNEAKDVG
jgi:hypothetical protein